MDVLTELPPLSQEEITHMNGFWAWLKEQPKPSPYKPWITVKVKRSSSVQILRDQGHKYFDMIWREFKLCERNELYGHLSSYMYLPIENTHFSLFNPKQCIEAIEFSIQHLNDDRRLDMDLTGIEPRAYFYLVIK